MNGSFSLFLKLEAECELSLEDLKGSQFFQKLRVFERRKKDYISFLTQIFHLEKDASEWRILLDRKDQKFCLKHFEQYRRKLRLHPILQTQIENEEGMSAEKISVLRPQPLTTAIVAYSHYMIDQEQLPAYLGLIYGHDKILFHLAPIFKAAFTKENEAVEESFEIFNEIKKLEDLWNEARDKLFLQIDFDEEQAHSMIYTAKTYIRLWFHLLENVFLEVEDPRFWGVSKQAFPVRIDSLVEYYLNGL